MLPELFVERLKKIIPQERLNSVLTDFSSPRLCIARINMLKTTQENAMALLLERGILYDFIKGVPLALLIKDEDAVKFKRSGLLDQGFFYCQGLASMFPPLVLNPQEGQDILDLCAAPGSKSTQLAAMMANTGRILCVDCVKSRMYKWRSVAGIMGMTNADFKLTDGRRLKSDRLFDKILVDAPCSAEGRFRMNDRKSFNYWSLRKIREMRRKQRGLVRNAARLLKPGGEMVYATCTLAPEENEGVVDWLLRKSESPLSLEPVEYDGCPIADIVPTYPALDAWGEKTFSPQIHLCCRILPSSLNEGFFMARFKKE